MRMFFKLAAGAVASIAAIGFMTASAQAKPAYCAADHDHRSHAADYYDYYAADRYYRAGAYRASSRSSGVSLSIRLGDGRYDRDRYRYGYGDRYDDRRYDRRRGHGRSQVLKRRVYDTRGRARIVLVEELRYGHRGRRDLVCTIDVRGPDARFVSKHRLRGIARRDCSRRAHVRFI